MVVAFKNSTNLSSLCVTWAKKKCPLFLFHSLTLSLCFSLSLRTDYTSQVVDYLFLFLLTLELTQNGRNSLFQLSAQGRMASVFFLFFFAVSVCPTRLSQALLRGMADMKTFGSKLINELWQGMGWTHMVLYTQQSPPPAHYGGDLQPKTSIRIHAS